VALNVRESARVIVLLGSIAVGQLKTKTDLVNLFEIKTKNVLLAL